jgi:hypothetical protein
MGLNLRTINLDEIANLIVADYLSFIEAGYTPLTPDELIPERAKFIFPLLRVDVISGDDGGTVMTGQIIENVVLSSRRYGHRLRSDTNPTYFLDFVPKNDPLERFHYERELSALRATVLGDDYRNKPVGCFTFFTIGENGRKFGTVELIAPHENKAQYIPGEVNLDNYLEKARQILFS